VGEEIYAIVWVMITLTSCVFKESEEHMFIYKNKKIISTVLCLVCCHVHLDV
jgi:hypothetical protein